MKLKIRHKLFLTILLSSSIVAGGLFFILQWSFDRGFLNYVNNQELAQLTQLAEELASYYERESSWENLQDNHRLWRSIQRYVFQEQMGIPIPQPERFEGGGRPGRPYDRAGEQNVRPLRRLAERPDPGSRPTAEAAQAARLVDVAMRIVLLDADKNRIMGGGPRYREEMGALPIELDGETIGYLDLVPITEVSSTGDLLFMKQQKTTFAIVTLMMFGISVLLTYPVTNHLIKPIKYLTEGTRKLIGGKFVTRIQVTSSDELGTLSEDFNMLAMTLEQNEEARQRWIADISHELRTPLAVLRGEMEALLDGVRKTGPDTLGPLHSEILHMQRLVNDLYELSMSDIGALTYKKIPVNIMGILEGTVELCEKRCMEKGLEIKHDLPVESSASLLGDPDRLQQLFSNLLQNSMKYTDGPGVLEILAEESAGQIIIKFQDSGPGVTSEQLPLLFERLYRTDPSRNRARSGAGLGLAICSNIVEAHQGKISSYSSPLGGLGIRIELPITS